VGQNAKEIANEKRFFHWELEFPEVFFEGHQKKENPGFDAVIGNPPYVSNWELTSYSDTLPTILESLYPEVTSGHWDLYVLFIYRALTLTNSSCGYQSFIVPSSLATEKYGVKLREYLLSQCKLIVLVNFGQHLVLRMLRDNT
jgi:methylase of polypeptide subunit release factors